MAYGTAIYQSLENLFFFSESDFFLFWNSLLVSFARNSLFFERFSFIFSWDFRGSLGKKNPCLFGGFPCLFPKRQGKEDEGLFQRPIFFQENS